MAVETPRLPTDAEPRPAAPSRRSGKFLPWLIVFAAIFLVLLFLFENRVQSLNNNAPADFPVLIITNDDQNKAVAQIVQKGSLSDFISSHPNYTYLVPPGQVEALQQQLKPNDGDRDTDNLPTGLYEREFTARPISDGRQYLEVKLGGEGMDTSLSFTGWYEATAQEIYPKQFRRRSFNTVIFFIIGFFSLIGTVAVYTIVRIVRLIFYRSKTNQTA